MMHLQGNKYILKECTGPAYIGHGEYSPTQITASKISYQESNYILVIYYNKYIYSVTV